MQQEFKEETQKREAEVGGILGEASGRNDIWNGIWESGKGFDREI